jgi:hypothetical protein
MSVYTQAVFHSVGYSSDFIRQISIVNSIKHGLRFDLFRLLPPAQHAHSQDNCRKSPYHPRSFLRRDSSAIQEYSTPTKRSTQKRTLNPEDEYTYLVLSSH